MIAGSWLSLEQEEPGARGQEVNAAVGGEMGVWEVEVEVEWWGSAAMCRPRAAAGPKEREKERLY
jgi:hypothetical protein